MICLQDQNIPADLEQAFPMAYPWNDTRREDVARFVKANGWWKNPSAPENGKALLSCVGDLICEPRLTRAYRYGDSVLFHPVFQFVRPILRRSDFVIGNLETTVSDLTPDAGQYHTVAGKYHCNTTESFLDALRYAGFDGVVNANNHNCDSGALGLIETNKRLDRHGFLHTGTFLPGETDRAALVNINGIKVGILSYANRFNKLESNFTPLGQQMLNPISPEKVRADVAWARAQGAEFILSYVHWGKEYIHYPIEEQTQQAQYMADAGVDYIVGSHSHCLQINDRITACDGRTVPVIYSMGNFLTNEAKDLCRYSGILQILLEKTDTGIHVKDWFVPCYIFDSFETGKFCPVPTDSMGNGGFDHPQLQVCRAFCKKLITLPEPNSNTITAPELCKLFDIPETDVPFAISGVCTEPARIRDRQLYFASGEETAYEKMCLFRRRPILAVDTKPHPDNRTLVVPDVKKAYQQLIAHLRSRLDGRLITVAGTQDKTVTAELIAGTLKQAYRVCRGSWEDLHPGFDWYVWELRRGPLGYPALEPNICVLTSYMDELPPLTGNTRIFYNGSDEKLSAMMRDLPNATAFMPAAFPGMRMAPAAGAAAAVAGHLGVAPLKDYRYSGMEQNIFEVNGITVLTDYACKNEASAKAALAALEDCPGKKIAVLEDTYAPFAKADAVISVPQPSDDRQQRQLAELALETEMLSHLEPGCAVLLCGGRHLALNLTLRRVFGLTDGDICDLT